MEKQVTGYDPIELNNVCKELQKCSESLSFIMQQIQKDYDELNAAVDTVISKMKETDEKLKCLRNGTY